MLSKIAVFIFGFLIADLIIMVGLILFGIFHDFLHFFQILLNITQVLEGVFDISRFLGELFFKFRNRSYFVVNTGNNFKILYNGRAGRRYPLHLHLRCQRQPHQRDEPERGDLYLHL